MFKPSLSTLTLFFFSCCYLFASGRFGKPGDGFENLKIVQGDSSKLSIVQKLKEIDNLPIQERIALYYKLKKESPKAYDFKNEQELTMYGYSFLWNNKLEDALAIFKLIAAEFPESANAFDSLGEAYLKMGDNKLSLINYQIALKLNPDNFNAEDQIERINFPGKVPETPAQKFGKLYSIEEYKADLDQLGNTLLKVHPNALKFISKKDFWEIVEKKKALITSATTYGEFAWHCSEIIASVHCSHTSMGSFWVENDMLPLSLRFPIQTRWVNNQLFVIDPKIDSEKLKVKDEILSVNGIPVSKLLADIYEHIPAQGYIKTTKQHFFNSWSTGMISFALGFPKKYKVMVKGNKVPIELSIATTSREPFANSSIKRSGKNLSLEWMDDKTAIMTIASFNYYPWDNLGVFKTFIDKSFEEVNSKGAQNLVIDVRFNTGGSQQSSIHLLRYLLEKPFVYYSKSEFKGKTGKIDGEEEIAPFENRYKGKLFFMMDGIGNSTTGHFMSLVKVFKLGKIVGEELGSNQFCSAGQTICRLKNTKLEYYVADNTHISTATSLPDGVGILPDYYVTQTIEEYLKKIDAVKEATLKLVRTGSAGW